MQCDSGTRGQKEGKNYSQVDLNQIYVVSGWWLKAEITYSTYVSTATQSDDDG